MGGREERELADVFARHIDHVGKAVQQTLPRMLKAIRSHLNMDVAFVAEFVDGRRVFRRVDLRPGLGTQVQLPEVGGGHLLEATYCKRIVDGILPELIPDTALEAEICDLAATRQLHIGAYMGVPLRLNDGHVYGTLCCYSFEPDRSLNDRDLGLLRVIAEAVSDVIGHDLEWRDRRQQIESGVEEAVSGEGISTVYQPIVDLQAARPVGYEALSRFSIRPEMDAEAWFTSAAEIGKDLPLEIRAIELALAHFHELPSHSYMALNVSAEGLVSRKLKEVLCDIPLERVVLEITERAPIRTYDSLLASLKYYRDRGARLAVDDAGAGYASFRHILVLQPDLIKLDKSLVRDIDTDPSRRELATALIQFSNKTGSQLIAEGVETEAELSTLRAMGVVLAQGFYLGAPAPLDVLAA